jgi:riboflavin kinase/FMN adenylyltransferase
MMVARSAGSVAPDRNSVVTVGTFDGVHLGHRVILDKVVTEARRAGGRAVVITFDPHPKSVVGTVGEPVRVLTTPGERAGLLEGLGIDLLVILPFTREFSRQTAREFVSGQVAGAVGARHVVVGHDHHFGREREGGIEELERLGTEFGFTIERIPAFTLDGQVVSSTTIRAALAEGDIRRANGQLGRRYTLQGRVVDGDKRGRTLGFPTANLEPSHPGKMIPGRGVYVVAAAFDGIRRYGMMNIGVRPTVGMGLEETYEVHLLEFEGDVYGHTLTVEFISRLREERRFPSLQDLVDQIRRDLEASLAVIKEFEEHHSQNHIS